jgi:hypothetical protein
MVPPSIVVGVLGDSTGNASSVRHVNLPLVDVHCRSEIRAKVGTFCASASKQNIYSQPSTAFSIVLLQNFLSTIRTI